VTDDQVAARPRKVTPARAAAILAERDPVIARLVADAGLPSFARPTETHFTAIAAEDLRTAGLSGNKALSVKDLAAKVLDGTVVLDSRRLARESNDEIVARLPS
jgi:DNA-3-methyladenine glycosylase II